MSEPKIHPSCGRCLHADVPAGTGACADCGSGFRNFVDWRREVDRLRKDGDEASATAQAWHDAAMDEFASCHMSVMPGAPGEAIRAIAAWNADTGVNLTASNVEGVPDSLIRDVFLANGFKIKPGHDDLKPYVYTAARELLKAAVRHGREGGAA